MKNLLFIGFIFLSGFSVKAQTFHFVNHSYNIVKTTDQSPVHFYIEIYNDLGVDTMLRWKTHFITIPSQWVINFDDQTNNLPVINDGDSADFVLQSGLSFPQKLIIGATTNNTVGTGRIEFEIYDPYAPNDIDTIIFFFNITQGTAALNELDPSGNYKIENNQITLSNGEKADFYISDSTGKMINESMNTEVFELGELKQNEIYFIKIVNGKNHYSLKIMN